MNLQVSVWLLTKVMRLLRRKDEAVACRVPSAADFLGSVSYLLHKTKGVFGERD